MILQRSHLRIGLIPNTIGVREYANTKHGTVYRILNQEDKSFMPSFILRIRLSMLPTKPKRRGLALTLTFYVVHFKAGPSPTCAPIGVTLENLRLALVFIHGVRLRHSPTLHTLPNA